MLIEVMEEFVLIAAVSEAYCCPKDGLLPRSSVMQRWKGKLRLRARNIGGAGQDWSLVSQLEMDGLSHRSSEM